MRMINKRTRGNVSKNKVFMESSLIINKARSSQLNPFNYAMSRC